MSRSLPRLALCLGALAGPTTAVAQGQGQLSVIVDRPVAVLVDGQIVPFVEGSTTARMGGLFGRHEVSIRNLINKELWSGTVEVPDGYDVRCRWKSRVFDCYEAIALPVVAAPVVVVEDRTAPVTTTTTTTTTTTNGGFGVSVSEGPGGASVSIGLGGVPGFGVVVQETTTVTTRPDPVAPERPVPDRVELVVRNTDGEWADVLVDGRVVIEFRNDDEASVWIAPGTHTIEVREFLEDRPYARGRLTTDYQHRVTLGIAEDSPVTCYDHDGWQRL